RRAAKDRRGSGDLRGSRRRRVARLRASERAANGTAVFSVLGTSPFWYLGTSARAFLAKRTTELVFSRSSATADDAVRRIDHCVQKRPEARREIRSRKHVQESAYVRRVSRCHRQLALHV